MRNKYGIVEIKVRAKDPSTINLASFTIDDLIITGNIEDAKGGKLILFDVYIANAVEDTIEYSGIVKLIEDNYIRVLVYDGSQPQVATIYYNGLSFDFYAL